MIGRVSNIIEIKAEIFPLSGIELPRENAIADHINLSGASPKTIGFIPITDLYESKDGIIVACLKEGVVPNAEEEQALKDAGASAYSYSLLNQALYAGAAGKTVSATGFVPTLPNGFQVGGTVSGNKQSGAKDMGLIYSEKPCDFFASFTTNKFKAPCVSNNQKLLGKQIRALICSSGPANVGDIDVCEQADMAMRDMLAKKFSIASSEVLTASTGKIGLPPDLAKLEKALASFDFIDKHNAVYDFAQAVLTTDLVTKIYQTQNMLGVTKGSGMIAPNMATMLAFIVSDLDVDGGKDTVQTIVNEAVNNTFNCISVDGDTSTNDMVVFMTNCSGAKISADDFKLEFTELCENLAKKIIIDGEGATKLITTHVKGAGSEQEARTIAKSIINSNLVKTAVFGADPNWGRILAAAGYAGVDNVKPEALTIKVLGEPVYQQGKAMIKDAGDPKRDNLSALMKKNFEILIELDLAQGDFASKAWGADLSYDYVTINAEYFT